MKKFVTLKYVRFKSRGRKGFVAPPLHTALAKAIATAKIVAHRHVPSPSTLTTGTNCLFVNSARTLTKRDGIMIDLCSYAHGVAPEQFSPNLAMAKAKISAKPITNSSGQPQEIAHTYRALAFGQSIILETVRGGGGIDQLEDLLSWLLRTYCDSSLPRLELLDVTGTALKDAIKAGGGATSMTLKIVDGSEKPKNYFAKALGDLRKHVSGARNLSVTWETEGADLDLNAVSSAFDAYDEVDGIDNIVIHLARGGKIDHLRRYRERRELEVMTIGRTNAPDLLDLKGQMRDYLDELRTPVKGWRMLDDDGNFVNPQVFKAP